MCIPMRSDGSSSRPGSSSGSLLGIATLMLLACLVGPALATAVGGLGGGLLLGAGGVIFALALCAVVPAAVVALRRRRRSPEA
jgi:hypothetical protein